MSTVAAIIWTYRGGVTARRCIDAVLAQTRRPDQVLVVDSHSGDGSVSTLRALYPSVAVLELDENAGPGAALTAGLEHLAPSPPDVVWLVEDDSEADPECLEMALQLAERRPGFGLLAPVGCRMRRGQWYATAPLDRGNVAEVDFVVLDGAILPWSVVQTVGCPRTDYFIMMVDIEYPLRIAATGRPMLQAGLPYRQLRLGAASPDSSWRSYYQTRNHLAMAIASRSPALVLGFFLRTGKHVVRALIDRDMQTLQFRSRGVLDALRRNMGRVIEPSRLLPEAP